MVNFILQLIRVSLHKGCHKHKEVLGQLWYGIRIVFQLYTFESLKSVTLVNLDSHQVCLQESSTVLLLIMNALDTRSLINYNRNVQEH